MLKSSMEAQAMIGFASLSAGDSEVLNGQCLIATYVYLS